MVRPPPEQDPAPSRPAPLPNPLSLPPLAQAVFCSSYLTREGAGAAALRTAALHAQGRYGVQLAFLLPTT